PPFSSTPPPHTVISPLSLHDALPISPDGDLGQDGQDALDEHLQEARPLDASRAGGRRRPLRAVSDKGRIDPGPIVPALREAELLDRKSTRLNSSHDQISYAVFCLKKK